MANRVWKDGTRRGIAYVEGRVAAEQVMVLAGRRRADAHGGGRRKSGTTVSAVEVALDGAMAVYSDRRGRPFAWQIPFDIRQWDQVSAVIAGSAGDSAQMV